MQEIHITFDSKEAEEKLLADEKFVKAMNKLICLAHNMNNRVQLNISIKTDCGKGKKNERYRK